MSSKTYLPLRGLEWSCRVSVDQWSQIRITLMRGRIRIRIEVKSWIPTRIRMMRIRNLDVDLGLIPIRYFLIFSIFSCSPKSIETFKSILL
jgi:hypothetical protein